MAGPFDFSASSFIPGGQGTNNQSISPEMLARLMALMQGGGGGADLGLLSQAITPTSPRFSPIPITPPGGGQSALKNALSGQPLAAGAGAGPLDWAKALAGDINSKVGTPLPNPLVAQPASTAAATPATNTPLGGTAYTAPNVQDWQNAIAPAKAWWESRGDIAPGKPLIDWGQFYANNIKPTVDAAGNAIQPGIQSLNALAGDVASGKAMDSLGGRLNEAGKWIGDTTGNALAFMRNLPQDPTQVAAGNMQPTAANLRQASEAIANSPAPFKVDPSQTGFQNTLAAAGNWGAGIPKAVGSGGLGLWANVADFFGTPEQAIADAAKKKFDEAHPDQGKVSFNIAPQAQGGTTSGGLPTPAPLTTSVGGGTQTTQPAAATGGFDPNAYIAGTYNRESGGNWNAVNKQAGATASGAGQFTAGTWMDFMTQKHPDAFGRMTDKEILNLRFDPNYMNQAMQWNMDRGIKVLDDLGLPLTNGGIYATHMLGPGGARRLLSADPSTPIEQVLDAAQIKANPGILRGTVQDVLNNFEASYGDPTKIVPHGPTNRPQQVGPDTTETMKWVEESRPKPTDAQLLKNAQFNDVLAGFGAGLGGSFENGGQLFGNLAAGTGQGAANAANLGLTTSQADEAARAAYAGGRGELALKLATLQSDLNNGNMDRAWQDQQDLSNWFNQRTQSMLDYRTTQAAAAKEAATPKVLHTSDNALVYQDATGVHKVDLSSNTFAQKYEEMAKAYGADSAQARAYKYQGLTNFGQDAYLQEIVKDALKDGNAQEVFTSENYKAAMDHATKDLQDMQINQASPNYQEMLDKRLAGWLFVGTQQEHDTSWVERAARLGNPGAQWAWQNRTTTPAATPAK